MINLLAITFSRETQNRLTVFKAPQQSTRCVYLLSHPSSLYGGVVFISNTQLFLVWSPRGDLNIQPQVLCDSSLCAEEDTPLIFPSPPLESWGYRCKLLHPAKIHFLKTRKNLLLSKNGFLRDIWKRIKTKLRGQVWRHVPIIPSLGRLSQKDLEFKASLGYTASLSPKHKTKHYHSSFSKDKESEDRPKTDSFTHLWELKRHERSTRIPSGYTRGKGSWRWLHREISMEIQKLQPPLNSPWFGSPSYHLRLREGRPQEGSTLCGNL